MDLAWLYRGKKSRIIHFFIISVMLSSLTNAQEDVWVNQAIKQFLRKKTKPIPHLVSFLQQSDKSKAVNFVPIDNRKFNEQGFLKTISGHDLEWSSYINRTAFRFNRKSLAKTIGFLHKELAFDSFIIDPEDGKKFLYFMGQGKARRILLDPSINLDQADLLKKLGYSGTVVATRGYLVLVATTKNFIKRGVQGIVITGSERKILWNQKMLPVALINIERSYGDFAVFTRVLGSGGDALRAGAKVFLID